MSASSNRVLIAYDGSALADNAIDHAARLFPGAPTLVLTVWRSVRDAAGAARAALPQGIIDDAVQKLEAAVEAEAAEVARRGATRAGQGGLHAEARTLRADPSVWATIVTSAREEAAHVVVVGSRGRSGLRSALLGSVSNAVVHHCRQPVLVVHLVDPAS